MFQYELKEKNRFKISEIVTSGETAYFKCKARVAEEILL